MYPLNGVLKLQNWKLQVINKIFNPLSLTNKIKDCPRRGPGVDNVSSKKGQLEMEK